MTTLMDFQILTTLGKGAYSVVYKVQRIADNTIYAMKVVKTPLLSDKEMENAITEVRILASIKHPNVIAYKEAFVDKKALCIIMEYADDGDLLQKIKELSRTKRCFTENEIWKLFIQILRGLKQLHDLSILHRDLKCANIFLMKNMLVKLGDLNVSKVTKQGLGYTQTGTPYYTSPEIWDNKAYDSKSDMWSLGCILYEAIMLMPPFRAENEELLYKKVIKGLYQEIPKTYSPMLSAVIKNMLQVAPHLRPSCEKILKAKVIQDKIAELLLREEDEYSSNLIKTIYAPSDISQLNQLLPLPAYNMPNREKEFSKKPDSSIDSTKMFKVKDNYEEREPSLNFNGLKEYLPKAEKRQPEHENHLPKIANLNTNADKISAFAKYMHQKPKVVKRSQDSVQIVEKSSKDISSDKLLNDMFKNYRIQESQEKIEEFHTKQKPSEEQKAYKKTEIKNTEPISKQKVIEEIISKKLEIIPSKFIADEQPKKALPKIIQHVSSQRKYFSLYTYEQEKQEA